MSFVRPGRVVLFACLLSSLAACTSVVPVWVRRASPHFFDETPVGVLNLRTSPPKFESPPKLKKNFQLASEHSLVELRSQVDLLVDIVNDLQRSEPYKRQRSSFVKIVIGDKPSEFWLHFKNRQYFVIMSENSQPFQAGQELETRHGKFSVVESGVDADFR